MPTSEFVGATCLVMSVEQLSDSEPLDPLFLPAVSQVIVPEAAIDITSPWETVSPVSVHACLDETVTVWVTGAEPDAGLIVTVAEKEPLLSPTAPTSSPLLSHLTNPLFKPRNNVTGRATSSPCLRSGWGGKIQ